VGANDGDVGATRVSLLAESGRPLPCVTSGAGRSVFPKISLPWTRFVAEALRDIVVNYVCRDRPDHLGQFGVSG